MILFKFSVTEREILHGILQVENPEKSCLWFKRNIQDIENISASNILAKFIGSYFKVILPLMELLVTHVLKIILLKAVVGFHRNLPIHWHIFLQK